MSVQDISGFGTRVTVIASKSFPQGFTVTQFADDADAFDAPSVQIAEVASGLNGDMVSWSKAVPIKITLNVIPNTDDDRNLASLAEQNRPSQGKTPARDEITLIITYPDGRSSTISSGKMTDAPPTISVASAGRMKSNAYAFAFGASSRS